MDSRYNIIADDEKPLTSFMLNNDENHLLSRIAPSGSSIESLTSPLEVEEDEGTNEDSVSSSSSVSSQSLDLNPNSTIDELDLPGIALLKEIFPEETTDALRELHYQNIIANQTSSSSISQSASSIKVEGTAKSYDEGYQETVRGDREHHQMRQQQKPKFRHRNANITELPDEDFLRLPKSVAVLRERKSVGSDNGHDVRTYELIHDLESRAMQEYKLAARTAMPSLSSSFSQTKNPGRHHIEYNTYVVDRDQSLGLGMTLQEIVEEGDHLREQQQQYGDPDSHAMPGHIMIRFGLMVVGFIPDSKKIQKGEVTNNFPSSPAETAGILCGDVLIGINGTAFVMQVPLSSSFTVDRQSDEYKIQKQKVIQLIQNSPTPVVLHIRRHRQRLSGPTPVTTDETESIGKSFSERSVTSLLDTTTFDFDEGKFDPLHAQRGSFGKSLPIQLVKEDYPPQRQEPNQVPPTSYSRSLHPSSSSAFHKPSPSRTPRRISSNLVRHPLSIELARLKLISCGEDEWRITRRLQQFTDRTRQWESSNSLRIAVSGRAPGSKRGSLVPLFDPNDLPPDMAALMVFTQENFVKGEEIQHQDTEARALAADSDKFKEHQGVQNYEQSHPQTYIHAEACTRSTPPLPLDSPLIPFEYLQAFCGYEKAQEIRSVPPSATPSTLDRKFAPRRLFWPQGSFEEHSTSQHPRNDTTHLEDVVWIPLHGIRKSLSARILNSFVEVSEPNNDSNNVSRIAYTIWVYDVETGREWYAPIRYWEDFSDLRDAALELLPSSSDVYKEMLNMKSLKEPTIPGDRKAGWGASVFGSPSLSSSMSPSQKRRRQRRNEEFDDSRQQTCQYLEEFLRELIGIVYTCNPLHPNTAEIALYVQSFLGVDAGLEDGNVPISYERTFNSTSERIEDETRQLLKRSIQRYSWRIFLLHTMNAIVRDFVYAARARGPKLHEIESIENGNGTSLKTRAMNELLQIRKFLDQLVDLILDSCNDDLRSIAKRQEYSAIHKYFVDESYWERLVRESVREQVEIEVYVPLRSVVSRLLVNGWRNDDMEVLFKIKELRKRPQGMFRINKISPSHWQSVANILKQGVGMSTLPCVKLRAIVDAAKEVSQLYGREHSEQNLLGADEFLPIFIFCVVRAEMERPCALSILLQNLCDRINRIGEIGYFLASFEAAIAHIQEIDLTEDREDMLSFLTVPLTEVSLND